ncbi:hypothetical protein HW555_013272 [Spodoptera exigua]|uniref:Uncharacterized protein n=1 Tax=Spodoptera exigua TaxID=7107 RepID=A0A835KYA6_SPOEX|nr:hypothetical protein HW555_013272 [Spodoptera exigua]
MVEPSPGLMPIMSRMRQLEQTVLLKCAAQRKELWGTEEKVENWVELEVVAVKLLPLSRTLRYRSQLVNRWLESVGCAEYLRHVNPFPQPGAGHRYGFSPVWVRRWMTSCPDCIKVLWQWGHACGRSPVCMRACRCNFPECSKAASHTPHLYGRSLYGSGNDALVLLAQRKSCGIRRNDEHRQWHDENARGLSGHCGWKASAHTRHIDGPVPLRLSKIHVEACTAALSRRNRGAGLHVFGPPTPEFALTQVDIPLSLTPPRPIYRRKIIKLPRFNVVNVGVGCVQRSDSENYNDTLTRPTAAECRAAEQVGAGWVATHLSTLINPDLGGDEHKSILSWDRIPAYRTEAEVSNSRAVFKGYEPLLAGRCAFVEGWLECPNETRAGRGEREESNASVHVEAHRGFEARVLCRQVCLPRIA